MFAAPPARPSSWPPRGWRRSHVPSAINCCSRSGSQSTWRARLLSRKAKTGKRVVNCLICSSSSGSNSWPSTPPSNTSETSTTIKAAGRFRGRRRRSRVIGTSRATASTTAPNSTSSTHRNSQVSSPITTRASAPSTVRPFIASACQAQTFPWVQDVVNQQFAHHHLQANG